MAESLNMAALWKLPVVYIIENNKYAMGTSVERATAGVELSHRGVPYGIPGKAVDGMDVLAVRDAGLEAVERARAGEGPTILDVKTYRYRGHSMSDPAKYRTKEEVAKMREQHDPIDHLRAILIEGKHATEEDLKVVDAKVKEVVVAAADFAQASPEPDASELYTDILIGA